MTLQEEHLNPCFDQFDKEKLPKIKYKYKF